MNHPDPDLLCGALADLVGMLDDPDNIQTITTKGADPVVVKAGVVALKDSLGKKRNERDIAKVKHELAQRELVEAASAKYDDFTNLIDTISGLLGKKTPAGKEVLSYRKHVTGSDKRPKKTPPTPPTPPPPTP